MNHEVRGAQYSFDGSELTLSTEHVRKVVRITHAVTYSKEYGFVDGDPKTEAGVRSIPIPDNLVAEIRKHIDEYADPGDDGKLFHTATGNFVHHSEVEKAFIKARRKAGCEDVVLHGLRHSGNTYFAQNTDATIADLQARGGWSTSSMAAHSSRVRPWVLNPPSTLMDWGVSPMWPITGMPRSTR